MTHVEVFFSRGLCNHPLWFFVLDSEFIQPEPTLMVGLANHGGAHERTVESHGAKNDSYFLYEIWNPTELVQPTDIPRWPYNLVQILRAGPRAIVLGNNSHGSRPR